MLTVAPIVTGLDGPGVRDTGVGSGYDQVSANVGQVRRGDATLNTRKPFWAGRPSQAAVRPELSVPSTVQWDRCTDRTDLVTGVHARQSRRFRSAVSLLAAACLAIAQPYSATAAPEIVSWVANAPEWNKRLGITLMRQGCDAVPSDCLQRMRASAKAQQISHWALAVKRDPDRWPDEALEYSRLSLDEPLLVEVDIDDFLGALKTWQAGTLGRGNRVLGDVTHNLKRHNPRLRFGVTLYEDELDSPLIAWIPAKTRERVDRVSLYLHYRANARDYARYVADARRLFPRADIWAGSYAYDRIDYLPCEQTGSRPCSPQEERDLFRASLHTQLDLLRAGAVKGIEFYPGYFGWEDKWYGWSIERICRPERRLACIQNTQLLRNIVVDEFQRRQSSSNPSDSDHR